LPILVVMSISMTLHASTAPTGFEGDHQIPSNDLPFFPSHLSPEYQPIFVAGIGWVRHPFFEDGYVEVPLAAQQADDDEGECEPTATQLTLDDLLWIDTHAEEIEANS